MSSTLRVSLTVNASDLGCKPASTGERVEDQAGTTHDLVDFCPVATLATSGGIGTTFTELRHQVSQVERIVGDFKVGTDVIVRAGGVAAWVLGASGALTITDGWTLLFAIDGGPTVTATFLSTDNTPALAAKRINYAAGAQVASVDPGTARLRLDGVKTGGAGARARSQSFGAVEILSGTALAALGLVAGAYYGEGHDIRIGAGPFVHTFPPGALPRRIELSGSASGARIWVAGTAA